MACPCYDWCRFCGYVGRTGLFSKFYSYGGIYRLLYPSDSIGNGSILSEYLARYHHAYIDFDNSAGDGERNRTQSSGRSIKSQSGGHFAFTVVLGLALGSCRRSAFGAHYSGIKNCVREYCTVAADKCYDGLRQELPAGVSKVRKKLSRSGRSH